MSACLDGKSTEELFARHNKLTVEKPWKKDQHYFKNCQLTRLALMKIWSHAHEGALNPLHGNPTEVIGILLGYVADETVIVTDVIESPDFGSGHQVAVSDVGYEHIQAILEHNLKMGITATQVGMYHSHPKLGVFMSTVDISANRNGQQSDQHVSIVIDSVESVETGRLEIAAFRSYSIQSQSCPNPPPAPKEEPVETFAVDPLEESQGNGLGLGGLKLYRLGHQKSASDRENPHSEGLAFYKNGGIASSAGGYYRMKMGICKSATESEASMQMLPESWITPLLASPLIDSSVLAVQSTEEAGKKIAASSSARAGFEALSGSDSEMTRVACNCAALIAFQDRCMVIDKTKAELFQKPE